MITRYERVALDRPIPKSPNPNAASLVQELLGGKFGEMSTLMNYTFQSMNFRGREQDQARPFYDLIANIAAEEHNHIEAVTYTINLLPAARASGALTQRRRRWGRRCMPGTPCISLPAVRPRCPWTPWADRGPVITSSRAATSSSTSSITSS